MRVKPYQLYLFFVLFGLKQIVIAQTNPQKDSLAAQQISRILAKYKAVGAGVAIVKENQIIYNHSFGFKDLATQTKLTNTDIFRIASISKSFSSTAIMQLAAQNKLNLNDDFSNLIGFKIRNPKYPDRVITLKMVLSHTSSINDSQGYFTLDAINPSKNPNWEKCYNNYAPGAGYEYCNFNFNMIGAVIEKVSGERFDQYIKHHVLDKIGLYGGYCVDSLDKNRFVTLYNLDPNTQVPIPSVTAYSSKSEEIKNYQLGYSTPIFSPTGGMKISSLDLAKYMTMHMNYGKYNGQNIIKKKYAKLMQTKVSDEEDYGLALHSTNQLIDGITLIGHTGAAYGLHSAMFFDPKTKFGMVMIVNGCDPSSTAGYVNVIKESLNNLYQIYFKK